MKQELIVLTTLLSLCAGAKDAPSSRPAVEAPTTPVFNPHWLDGEHPSIGDPGFAPAVIACYPPPEVLNQAKPLPLGLDASEEFLHTVVWVVDGDYHVLGWFPKGKQLPAPFQDWQVTGLRPIKRNGSAAVFTNKKTGRTLEIDALVDPAVDPTGAAKLHVPVIRQVATPATRPAR
ncbi:MAG TPA: hypothetical protein VIM11_06000 [Tepidisphaeraceae bacterium]|jgi:hypothetical protein